MEELNLLNSNGTEEKIITFFGMYNVSLEYIDKIDSFSIKKYFYKVLNNVKLTKIDNLINELQLFLQIDKIKFNVDNVKGCIYFELSKSEHNILYFDELEDVKQDFLSACIGKDTNNSELFLNIEKAPHVLVSGTTGSGKSCLMNNIINSLINKYDKEELKMCLIDIKRVEFMQYNNIEQLATPIITESKKAYEILTKFITIMENRYKEFLKLDAKNISEYNAKTPEKICYYVIIIDELADLFMQLKEIETLLIRLCQLGRAAGIHVICATQRPDSQTITSKLKTNITTRIALSVPDVYSSRVILGESGAEKLTGNGDFLLKQGAETIRGQAALIRE